MLELLSLSELDPKQRTTLEIVRTSGRSLLGIIDDILDFSKIEAGKLEVRPEPASIETLVASVVGIHSGNASSKALVLRSRVDPRINPRGAGRFAAAAGAQQPVSNEIKLTSQGHSPSRPRSWSAGRLRRRALHRGGHRHRSFMGSAGGALPAFLPGDRRDRERFRRHRPRPVDRPAPRKPHG